jgi:adenylate kinase family enzyme
MSYPKFKRILIIGNGGSGKTYLANELANKLNLKVYHLDEYYWQNDGSRVKLNDWKKIHSTLTKNDSWIIEGTQMRLLKNRMSKSDFIIVLNTNLVTCLYRVVKKYIDANNQHGFPINKGLLKLVLWLFKFQLVYKKKLETYRRMANKPYIYIKNKKQAQAFLRSLT